MYHTPPKMVNTRNIAKKEMQKKVEEKKDAHHVRDESQNVEQHKVDKDDTGTQDARTMFDKNQPGPSVETNVIMSTKKSSVCSSTLAKKKRLEAEAAEAKARIRMELIDKKLEADLAELESSAGSSTTSSKKTSSKYKDRAVETWLYSNQQEVKTQCVTDHGINYDVLGPAPQESNLHHLRATGPQPLATKIALEARPLPTSSGTDETVHALASALKDLAAAGVNNSNDKMLSRLCTPRDLPLYSGDPLEWLQFKQAYEESSQVCNFSEKENLWRLRRSLQGPAKEAVTALLIGATSPDVVMSTLELQFGNPDIIITRIMQDITKLRPMAQEYFKDIIPFSVKVRNCVAAVTAIGCEDYLKGMNIVSVILSKLPTVLISKWTDYSYPFINDRNKPKLVILSEFLSEEAVKITKTSVNLFQVQSFSKQSYNDNRKTNRILLLNNEHSENNNSDTCCKNCHISKHSLQECNKFKKSMRKNRWTYVKRNGLCYKCLKSKHKHNSCPAPVCDVNDCGLPHHRLLHFTVKSVPCNNVNITDTTQTDTESPVETINHVTVNNNKILLKTVPIYLHGPNGTFRCFALLDDGSTVTLISEALASKTGLHGNKQSMRVCGAWNNSALLCQTEILNLNLSNDEGTKFTIRARSVKNLNLPVQNYADINLNNYELMKPEIKNVICNGQCKPELLIGQDNYDLMLPLQIIKTKSTDPFFTRTPLGWCMHGRMSISTVTNDEMKHTLLLNEEQNTESERIMREIQDEMRQMFAIETLGVSSKPRQNVEDVRAYEHLQRTAILKNGSWYVGIPWKDTTSTMPDSYDNALSRFRSIEKKMKSNPNFAIRYKERIDHLLINEYASELTETKNPERIWYLPHFGVDNPNKQKLRLVFDAAARNDGLCLNDYILKGPDLLTSLYGIMLRFRENRIAVTGDIRDMFLRIKILKEDRDAFRFLWRDSPGVSVKSWVMNSLIFGANCSPFISQFIKNKNADKFQSSMPSAVRAIHEQHYMDDYIDSLEDEATAIELVNDITYIHKQGGFEMRNWTSIIQSILRDLPSESLNSTSVSFKSGEQYEGERTLGLIWFPTDDYLAFDTSFKRIHTTILTGQNKPTKREMLRILMSVFDIHGFLSPITITGKIILQDTWRAGITWDDVIPEKIYLKWLRWLSAIKNLNHLRLPRHYAAATRNISCSDNIPMSETHDYSAHAPNNSAPRPSPYGERYTNLQLHVFCDASTQAMCAVAYWRWTDRENTIRVAFVSSKCRVAPVKYVSMPRLELQAAVMAGRLANVISSEHRMKAERKYFWCDSSTVLYWIRNNARNYKAYIVHRLGELDELTKVDEWRYIPTKLNVADIATREFCEIKTLKDEWLYGPLFLYNDDQSWPRELDIQQPDGNYVDLECINIIHNITRYLPAVPEPERFSSWLRLLKTMSMVLYFIGKCKKLNSCVDGAMMERAEKILLKYSQVKTFPDDLHNLQHNKSIDKKSKLFNLTPVLDDYGIIRLGGRIDAAPEISTNVKRPVILDGGCHVTHLIVKFYHMKACHGNQEMVVNEIKQKYWIIRLRPTVKYISSKCMLCRIKKSQPYPPRMGDLPEARLTHHQRPFTCTGVDLFGPLEVTVCRHREKRYGVIFTCLTIRAIHIEIVNELTTDALIMALRRMAARRGWPRYLYSDNEKENSEKGILSWFGHVERMDERRLTKRIYKARVNGQVGKSRPRRTYLDQIDHVLNKGQVKSTHNRRACMKALMKVEEAKEVCQDRSKRKDVISAYPHERKV